jgi:beta-glucosidase/6-phospho-beta-glucosidase/beta-galactosidase/glycosyltransferase involved in cell wall biosynthesis
LASALGEERMQIELDALLEGESFLWGVGIESSTLPHLGVDQFEWTQHNRFWRDDLAHVAGELGLRHLRYAIPWHYVEPEPGRFDFRVADERIEACHELGLSPLLDVMHFGTPRWLRQAVGDPLFPESLERLASVMVERYRGVVRAWCPFNEPLVTSLFSGDFGFWPPHARRWRGYMPVLARVAIATSRAIAAVRRADPRAAVLLCDAADTFQTADESLAGECSLRNLRRFLLLDLVGGRVDAQHPLHAWVAQYGISELDLEWLRQSPQAPDVIGLDYYAHSDWELARGPKGMIQRRASAPAGVRGVARDYYARYGLPMIVSETSIEGPPVARENWLAHIVRDVRRLREEQIPLVGLVWWPLVDHLDWDGALTHRIGKLHEVGLFRLARRPDGVLARVRTPLAASYAALAERGDEAVGPLDLSRLAHPVEPLEEPEPAAPAAWPRERTERPALGEVTSGVAAPAPAKAKRARGNAPYGIVVFSHLRWGFVWQRPQQLISRFAKEHPVLFVEEPVFDAQPGQAPRVELHRVMPNVTVACPHGPPDWSDSPALPTDLRRLTREAIERTGPDGELDEPVLWYYSPLAAAWSLGWFEHRAIVYDCMDELSQFAGAPARLREHESRLLSHADVVFTGGYELWNKKREAHGNAHFFGCGVEFEHFTRASDASTPIPPDIDFMQRPIIGWFGVVDERVDHSLVGEMARLRPDWSFAMVGPIVKVDPNLLSHAPNLYWLGGRDYSVLPSYCRAFDVCFMAFALNAATEFINPTKALEYLATGRPCVSTPVKDVVRQYADVMEIERTPQALVAAIERVLTSPDPDRIARGIERARASSWEETVSRMEQLVADALARRAGAPAAPIEPLADDRLEYAPTPGS